MKKDIFEGYENLKKVIANVENIPEIKKWIQTRPPTITLDMDKVRAHMAELLAKEQAKK